MPQTSSLLVAYSVRDILWLRLFAVAAAVVTIPYYLLLPTMLWAPLGWTVVFALINLLQSLRLFIERRPVKLTAEEEEVRRLLFKDLPPRKVLQVLSIGSWVTAQPGERMIESGTDSRRCVAHCQREGPGDEAKAMSSGCWERVKSSVLR